MGLMNGLTFGGINSLDYGIYISGEAVFNAPEREVEMLQIPGRNGDFVLDHGRFENIEVSYPAGTFGDDQTDFREKLSDFRNAILSQVGYQRLTDTYHPDEYRMGVYASGLEVAPVHYNTAGEFVLTFNCKPQRWLTSGETAVAVADGGTIDNPTLFESEPLLAVEGYGNINIDTQTITVFNSVIGDVILNSGVNYSGTPPAWTFTQTISLTGTESLNTGDTISIKGATEKHIRVMATGYNVVSITVSTTTGCSVSTSYSGRTANFDISYNDVTLTYGTSSSWYVGITSTIVASNGNQQQTSGANPEIAFTYDGDATITATFSKRLYSGSGASSTYSFNIPSIIGDSTLSTLGNPTYIDCDTGECYMFKNGEIVSLNSVIDLGSDLPKLGSGTNTINYDNTITDLKVTPRWWKV